MCKLWLGVGKGRQILSGMWGTGRTGTAGENRTESGKYTGIRTDTTSRWKNNIRTDTGITEEESDSYYCSGYRSSCIYYRWWLIIWNGWSCMAEEQCSVKD